MSRRSILHDLIYKLQHDIHSVKKATMRLIPFAQQKKVMTLGAYVGVVPGDEITLVTDGYDTRNKLDIALLVKTREDDEQLEIVIEDIKKFMDRVDLGSDVKNFQLITVNPVEVRDKDKTLYSYTSIMVELIYVENNTGTTYPSIGTRELTDPDAIAHYKLYQRLFSASYANSGSLNPVEGSYYPIVANVYDSHFKADISIPAGSGSLSIESMANSMEEDDGSVASTDFSENHMMSFTIRCNSAFISEFRNTPQPFVDRAVMDSITYLLWGRSKVELGDNYRVHEVTGVEYNQAFETTLGAQMIVIIEKVIEYE